MHAVITWLEALFQAIPLNMLQVWGGLGYLVGLVLMVAAYAGLTVRPNGRWGLGQTRQSWDSKAMLSMVITFAAIFATGYIGSFIVLVPGAQTFESLKDLSVFLCIVLFGYPALLIVPVAYGLSDIVEGVPPGFLLDWLPGYFVNPACFWVAHQLIGRRPDFRQAGTWGWYLAFVVLFMCTEPLLWGHITSPQFTPDIAYHNLTPALFFTTAITWLIAPPAMLVALPLARRYGMYWAEIPQHVRERRWGQRQWHWITAGEGRSELESGITRLPIRLLLAAPFIALLLVTVGATAYLTLSSAETASAKLAGRLHEEIAENINLRLDDYLEKIQQQGTPVPMADLSEMLNHLPVARHGRALVVDREGAPVASSSNAAPADDPVAQAAIDAMRRRPGALQGLLVPEQLHFDVITSKPLARETWLMQATPYQDRSGHTNWVLLTAMPEAWYLEGVRTGNSQSAMVFAVALLATLVAAIVLSALVTEPLRKLARATRELGNGELGQRVPGSRLEELGMLSAAFNQMAERLKLTFDELQAMTAKLAAREQSLEQSERQLRSHRDHLEEMVHERTGELSVAVSRAESANRAKSVFLSNMSHELRTPLNAVIGFSEQLASGRNLDAEQLRKLDMIKRSGHHLLTLINDILELSRIETGKLELQLAPVDLPALYETVLGMVRLRADPNHVELRLRSDGTPAVIMADGAKLRQVLHNLLSNAVRYVRQGHVELRVQREARLDGARLRLKFAVSDTGPGIAGPDQEQIFQPFVQADSTPATQSGTGLGLTISREFVRLMGSELMVDSELGEGSTFWFVLEVEECAVPSAQREADAPLITLGAAVQADDGATGRPTAEELRALPAYVRQTLKDAVASLDIAGISKQIATIGRSDPALAARLRRMVSAAQFQQLWALLE